jgi:hypothetical protein
MVLEGNKGSGGGSLGRTATTTPLLKKKIVIPNEIPTYRDEMRNLKKYMAKLPRERSSIIMK